MSDKLGPGDSFPSMDLEIVEGEAIRLPDAFNSQYNLMLFYRGHW